MIVEAGDLYEVFAASFKKAFPTRHGDFFKSLQAIRDKGGTDDPEPFDALLGELYENVIGIGPEPGIASEAGLKGDEVFVLWDARFFHKALNGLEALVTVAGGVGGVGCITASGCREAVSVRGVAFAEMSFGDAVEGEEEFIIGIGEVGSGALDEGLEVVFFPVKGLEQGGLDVGGLEAEFVHEMNDSALVAGHGVVGVERDDKELLNSFPAEFLDRLRGGGISVAHGEFHGKGGFGLEKFLKAAACQDEGRAAGLPNFPVGVRGGLGAAGKDEAIDDEPSQDLRAIKDAPVHEELAEVTADVFDFGGIGGAEIEEEDSFFRFHVGSSTDARMDPVVKGRRFLLFLIFISRFFWFPARHKEE